MVRKFECVKQGDLDGGRSCPGVRVSIVALSRCNWRGAKGDREMDT